MYKNIKKHPLFLSSIILVLFLSIFSCVSYFKIKNYVIKTSLEKQVLIMKNLQSDINYWFAPKIDIISELSKELEIHYTNEINYLSNKDNNSSKQEILHSTQRLRVIHTLKNTKNSIESIQVYIGLKNGLMLLNDGRAQSKGYDPRIRNWYKEGIKSNKTIISDSFRGRSSNQLTIGIMSPLIINKKIKGVLCASFFLNNIYQKINKTKIEGGYAFIINSKGRIIIHPNKELINKKINDISVESNKPFYNIKKQKEGVIEYMYKGDKKIMTFSELDNGWFVAVSVKEDIAYSFIKEMLKFFSIFGILIFIITLSFISVFLKKSTS